MVQISRRKLPEEIISKLFILFFEVVGKKNKQEEFTSVINDLFSTTERIMIVKRIAMIYLLLKNIDQRTIVDTLKVSPSTVSKFSFIAQESKGISPFIKSILSKEMVGEFFEDIFFNLFSPPTKYHSNWSMGRKLELERKRRRERGI